MDGWMDEWMEIEYFSQICGEEREITISHVHEERRMYDVQIFYEVLPFFNFRKL